MRNEALEINGFDILSDRSLVESQRNQMMFDVYELHSQSRHNLYRLKHNNRKQTTWITRQMSKDHHLA